jgi:hypothetical protein
MKVCACFGRTSEVASVAVARMQAARQARRCASRDAQSHGRSPSTLSRLFFELGAIERARYGDDESGVSQFVVRNRTRHRIAPNPLQVFGNDVIPLAPGLGKSFWETAAAVPTEMKRGHQLYRRLFERRFPKALDVPAVSGRPIGSAPGA